MRVGQLEKEGWMPCLSKRLSVLKSVELALSPTKPQIQTVPSAVLLGIKQLEREYEY
jgi:hypothetical protein